MKVTRTQLNKIISEALSKDPPFIDDSIVRSDRKIRKIIKDELGMPYEEFMKLPLANRQALSAALDPERPEPSFNIPDPQPELDAQRNFVYFPDSPALHNMHASYSAAYFDPEDEYHSGRMDMATSLLSAMHAFYGKPEPIRPDSKFTVPKKLLHLDKIMQKRVYFDLIRDIHYMDDTIKKYKSDPDFAQSYK